MANVREEIIKELAATVSKVSGEECESMASFFKKGARTFFAGTGRSGFAVKGFAMRMMHMGFASYVVGETTTPGIQKGDNLFIVSGSGSTASLVANAKKAKEVGAKVLLVTINPQSPIGKIADAIIRIPAPSPKIDGDTGFTSIQPMGSLAEQAAGIVLDSLVLDIMAQNKLTTDELFVNHANLE